MAATTKNSRDIDATAEEVFRAFREPAALEFFQAPGDMTARVHAFDFRVGGGYEMSLYYPEGATEGKTTANEDKFRALFVEIVPNEKIVQAIRFETGDAGFAGEMIMEVTFQPIGTGTRVTFRFNNLPPSVKPEDNEAGTISTLEKLAAYVERPRK